MLQHDLINLLKYHKKHQTKAGVCVYVCVCVCACVCPHLHSVRQRCIQHCEDSQVSAEVRHGTAADVLEMQISKSSTVEKQKQLF